ncbi:pentapeptide repeat-containing protein [Leptolyngbya sp. FACHB-671]|uniref:pentapeptide repeat-containing protein n=1 Tax=Leptolyngbya sp. FACHB-671 TaxID=2692812 RepID=UPI0016874E2C|nr:pentapeptide repeat-containing protein [Leptolyngbya sp. FACHB-671]MBD2066692.1 pentapeptide repeat-containing protein [Leptolyngbya sp. FACHB-671]
MINEEYLALLKEGVEAWNEWRRKNPIIPDLTRAGLHQATLSEANFRWADLTQANLNQADLTQATFRWADLTQANLSEANLTEANLSAANLSQTNLSAANLAGANLRDANLTSANLSRADLSKADLSGQDRSGVILVGADLKDANLSGANLSGADLTRADLSRVNLSEADLSNTDLSRANLSRVDLSKTDLRGTNLSGTDLRRANLTGADLSGTDLHGTDLREATLIRANLNGANLTGANLTGANLFKAQALGTNFTQAILEETCVEDWSIDRETNFSGAIFAAVGLDSSQSISLPPQSSRAVSLQSTPQSNQDIDSASVDTTHSADIAPETVELVFDDGIDWQAFLLAFQDLQVKYGEQNLTIQAIANPNELTCTIQLSLPLGASKAELEGQARTLYKVQLKALELSYQTELQATDEQIATYRRQSADLLEVVKLQAIRATQTETQFEEEHSSSDGTSQDLSRRIKITPEVKKAIVKGLDAYAPPALKQPVFELDAFESPRFDNNSEP